MWRVRGRKRNEYPDRGMTQYHAPKCRIYLVGPHSRHYKAASPQDYSSHAICSYTFSYRITHFCRKPNIIQGLALELYWVFH